MEQVVVTQMLQHAFRKRRICTFQQIDMLIYSVRSNADLSIHNTQPIRHRRPRQLMRVVKKPVSM
jgi:hypothetical protein